MIVSQNETGMILGRGEATLKHDYTLATVSKVLDILEFLAQQNPASGLTGLSESLNMPKSTLFRYLVTLEDRGYVRKNPRNGEYALGLKILELSTWALGHMTVHEVALPYLRALLDQFQETVNLGVLEHNEVVYVEILESPQFFKMAAHVGGRDSVHSTSIGKAILASLREEEVRQIAHTTGLPKHTQKTITSLPQLKEELASIRQHGYAIDSGENEEGACCVGAPIFDHRGDVIAAISISGPDQRFSAGKIEEVGAALVEVTRQVSQEMGYFD
jgi:DNA-binding IclR family transcriptional regulator